MKTPGALRTIGEVSADRAYASYDNFDVVEKAGGVPYILFRANASGVRGGVYEKMFHLYHLNKDAYLAAYVSHYRAHDPRRLWTSGSGWPLLPENQYHVTPTPRIQQWGEELKSRINSMQER